MFYYDVGIMDYVSVSLYFVYVPMCDDYILFSLLVFAGSTYNKF